MSARSRPETSGCGGRPGEHDAHVVARFLGVQHRRTCCVGIGVEADGLALRCGRDQRQCLPGAAVVFRQRAFVVRDDDGDIGAARGLEGLLQGFDHAVVFIAHMRGVDAALGRDDLRQRHDLIGIGTAVDRIKQAGREADGPGVEAVAQQHAHAVDLAGRGPAGNVAHRGDAQGAVADQRSDIDRRTGRIDLGGIVGEGAVSKALRRAEQIERWRRRFFQLDRCAADPAIANDDRGDALGDLRPHGGFADDGEIVMGVAVDKAGRQDQAGGVDHLSRRGRIDGIVVADPRNAVAANRQVGFARRSAGSIDQA